MKILLTNDDGWDAPGLARLKSVVQSLGEIWTVAPTHPMSGISHQMTFERPLQLLQTGEREFSLDGTPADCVRIAITQLDVDFDWVLSGINNGANLGADIYVSGTVAAAREAALHGVSSIAFSQHRRKFKSDFDWTLTGQMACKIFSNGILDLDYGNGNFLNINFPDLYHGQSAETTPTGVDSNGHLVSLEIVTCEVDRHPLPSDFQIDEDGRFFYCSKYHDRPQMPGGDLEVCFAGKVSVSVLRMF